MKLLILPFLLESTLTAHSHAACEASFLTASLCRPLSYLRAGLPFSFASILVQFVFCTTKAVDRWYYHLPSPVNFDSLTVKPLRYYQITGPKFLGLSVSDFFFFNQKKIGGKCLPSWIHFKWPREARGSLWRLTQHTVILEHLKWMFLNKWHNYRDFSVFKFCQLLWGMTLERVNQRWHQGIFRRLLLRLLQGPMEPGSNGIKYAQKLSIIFLH